MLDSPSGIGVAEEVTGGEVNILAGVEDEVEATTGEVGLGRVSSIQLDVINAMEGVALGFGAEEGLAREDKAIDRLRRRRSGRTKPK